MSRRLLLEMLEPRMVLSANPAAPQLMLDAQDYDPTSILVRFQPGAAALRAGDIFPGASDGHSFSSVPGLRVVELGQGVGVQAALHAFGSNPNVLYAEPNYVQHVALTTPNDTSFNSLYGLHNTGQSGGTIDADIDAPEAWDITTGNSSIVVGVIDTGVNYNHPDLAANMWKNTWELNGVAGTDDDGNGFVDDVYGYDFVGTNDSNPMDDHFHGTHVSGTIGAVGNNNLGVVGVNWNVKIMALKFLNSGGSGTTEDAIQAVDYATMMRNLYNSTSGAKGANIVLTSNSWGGGGFSLGLQDAIAASGAANMLFVAAAGNGNTNTDAGAHYPSSYPLGNIISVAATDRNDAKASFSNWGATTVDLAAPGVDVLSTSLGTGYTTVSGTSMATPHVAGVAALAWGLAGNVTYQEIRDAIFNSVDPNTAFRKTGPNPVATGGRLNAFKTLQAVGMSVGSSTPAAGSIIASTPTDFVVNFSHPYLASTVAASDLTVNTLAANSFELTDLDTVTFKFLASPVTAEGVQTMHMAAGAVAAAGTALPDPLLHEWTATFRHDLVRMEVVSASPPGPNAGLPLTTYVVNLNEAVLPSSVSTSDLKLSLGTVTGYSLGNGNTTISFTLAGITEAYAGATLGASIDEGAFSDGSGNPNLAFNRSYGLVLGMGVDASSPAAGEVVSGTPPKDFIIDFTFPYNTDPLEGAVVDAADLTVNGKPADSFVILDGDSVKFQFTSPPAPALVQGEWTMNMAAGAVTALPASGLPVLASIAWTASFRYDETPMVIASTTPGGPRAGVPLTTFDLHLNEVVDPNSVSASDLYLYHDWWGDWYVEGVEVLPGNLPGTSKIRFDVQDIWDLGNLYAYVAPGAFTDEFGNPSQYFEGWYELVTGMGVAGSTPAAGNVVGTPPTDFVIDFTLPIDLTTLDADGITSDLTVNGHPADSFSFNPLLDPDTVTFHFSTPPAPALIEGEWTMHMEAGAVEVDPSIGLSDPGNIEWNGTFWYDTLPMTVVSTTPSVGANVTLPFPPLDIHLNEPVLLSSVQTDDLVLSQGSVTGFTLENGSRTIRFTLAGITGEGTLNAYIAAGSLTDTFGNPNLAFSGSYTLDIGTIPFPTPLAPVAPLGSLIFDPAYSGTIGVDDTDSFTIDVDAGQTITVLVTPSAGLQPTITLSGPKSGSATAGAAGEDAVLGPVGAPDPTLPGDPAFPGGVYTVAISGAAGTSGTYTVEIILNAALELESHDGATNNTPGTAQDISGSFIPLLPGIKPATRGAVLGQTDTSETTTPYFADFESGANGYTTSGLWHRSIGHKNETGHSATQSMYFGAGEKYQTKGKGGSETFTKGDYEVKSKGKVQAVAGTLTSPNIVLPAGGGLTLDFNYILQIEGTTSADRARLQISTNDGATWTDLATYFGDAESNAWRAADPVDISAYSGNVRLRFNFESNNTQNNFEGWYVDDVRIRQSIPHDQYKFTVAAGQKVTVVLEALAPGDINVLLRNAAGTTTLATGVAGPANVDKVIYNYGPLAAGTYNLAITGQANVPYSLVVTHGAVFDLESNNTLATAQPLDGTDVALGNLEFLTGLSWVAEHQESVLLTALGGAHPVTAGLTDEGLSNWSNSQHSYFTDTGDLSVLATNPDLQANILAGSVGSGRVAYFGLDPSWHQPVGETEQLIRNAVTWTGGAAANVLWVGPHSLGWNTIGADVTQIDIFAFAAQDLDGFDVIYVDASATEYGGSNILHDRAGDIAAFVSAGGGLVTDDGGYYGAPDFGWVPTGPGADVYSFSAAVGATIDLFTATPGDGVGEPYNTLNPHLKLFDPTGSEITVGLVRTILDAQGNEQIVYTVPTGGAGTYKVEITAEGGAGQYVLDPIAVVPALPPALSLLASAKTNRGAPMGPLNTSAPRPESSSQLNPTGVDLVLTSSTRGSQPEWLNPGHKADLEPSLLDLLSGATLQGAKSGLKGD